MKIQTNQLNLRPGVDLIKLLEDLAERFRGDKKKKNEVAVDVLENYILHWETAEKAKRDVIKAQLQSITEGILTAPEMVEVDVIEQPARKKRKAG